MLVIFALWLLPSAALGQHPVMSHLSGWVGEEMSLRGSLQGLAVHRHYAIALRDGGQCLVLDMRKHACLFSYQLNDNTTHCNNASFGSRRYKPHDPFPLLYVSSCYGDKACYVTRLLPEGSVTVQRILFDSHCFPVAQDWCVDAEEGYLYAYGGKRGGTLYLKQFHLPSATESDSLVVLTDADVLRTIEVHRVKVAQGSKVKNGFAYLPDGDQAGAYYLHVIDLATGAEVRTIDLNPIGLEPEGVDVRGRWIYVSFNTPDPKENKIYRFRR
jgi:hypothetical protein